LKDKRWGCIDRNGKLVIPFEWEALDAPFEGLIWARKGSQWRALDRAGAEVIPPVGDSISNFYEGLATVHGAGGDLLLDRSGKTIFPPGSGFSPIYHFSEGLIQQRSGNTKTGYVNRTGKLIIPPRWDFASEFHDGLANVRVGNRWGIIDRTGKEVIPPVWASIHVAGDGLYQTLQFLEPRPGDTQPYASGRMCYLDASGKIIWSSDGQGVGTFGPP